MSPNRLDFACLESEKLYTSSRTPSEKRLSVCHCVCVCVTSKNTRRQAQPRLTPPVIRSPTFSRDYQFEAAATVRGSAFEISQNGERPDGVGKRVERGETARLEDEPDTDRGRW